MAESPHSDVTTDGIRVQAAAQLLEHESSPDQRFYKYVYRIVISNVGEAPARLESRHWVIFDADNKRRDVRGPGVVGETPRIVPGESFEYMSACPLETEWGTMEGAYLMKRDDGSAFEAAVGRFFLVPSAPDLEPARPPALEE